MTTSNYAQTCTWTCPISSIEMADTLTHDEVKDYYGKKIKTSDDLQTNVCLISQDSMPQEAKEALKLLHPDITAK